ncbi:MAG: hypothetical protein JST21_04855 [Bacteroidetes bacterium]|nr:hypothetical protein [Bacteroidota bacterium]
MQFLKQFIIFLGLVAAISFVANIYVGTGVIGIDDGNIFLNYAHHLSQGGGFVFNAHGEKVEGFTSFLWVVICAAFYLITSNPEWLLICFCCLLTTVTITIVYREIKKEIVQIYPKAASYFFWMYCLFIISIGPSYFTWSVLTLMENALWNFLFTVMVLLVANCISQERQSVAKHIILVIAGCLLSLTRPESLAWNIVFTVILFWTSLQNKKKLFFPVLFFVCVAVVTAGFFLFRLHYFGYLFPNTYYAKVSPDKMYNFTEGFKYAISFLGGYQAIVSLLFMVMAVMLIYSVFKLKILNKQKRQEIQYNILLTKHCIIAVIVLIGFVLPCTTGGDHFGGFRFYQDLMLLFAFGISTIIWLFKNFQLRKTEVKFVFLMIVVLFFGIMGINDLLDLKTPAKTQLNYEFVLARDGREMAESFNAILPVEKPSIGLIAVGGFGLKYDGNTVDLMGLNNTLMGHSPGDREGIKNHAAFNKEIFYQLNPDLLMPSKVKNLHEALIQYYNLLNENNFDNQAMKNIFNDERFQDSYSPYFLKGIADTTGLFVFINKTYTNSLMNDKNILVQQVQVFK